MMCLQLECSSASVRMKSTGKHDMKNDKRKSISRIFIKCYKKLLLETFLYRY